MQVDEVVRQRYAKAAVVQEPALCCPVDYDPEELAHIPAELIEKDYGCGNPAKHVMAEDIVLDLGSGTGKACFIAAKRTGPAGKVIGIDFNPPMLELARKYIPDVAKTLGYENVTFRSGRIQDLALDLDMVDEFLRNNPVASAEDLAKLESFTRKARTERPLIADESVSLILSNCVLNLVDQNSKIPMFAELFRVLRRGGRAVISDIVSDEDVPEHLQRDPELWSGCISGAMREDMFLAAFEKAGFYGLEILERSDKPWQTVEGIEFRSMTVRAWKGKDGPCKERKQAVIYRGPWREVTDDDGHTLVRGERTAVCDKTYGIYLQEPYASDIIPVEPHLSIELDSAGDFDCGRSTIRTPAETKGANYQETVTNEPTCCGPDPCC